MALIDRDYLHDKHRQRPFSPPPTRSGTSTLGMALIFVAILFALYKIADWKLQQRTPQPIRSKTRQRGHRIRSAGGSAFSSSATLATRRA